MLLVVISGKRVMWSACSSFLREGLVAAPLIVVMDSSLRQRWKLCVRHVVGKSGLSHVCVIVWE